MYQIREAVYATSFPTKATTRSWTTTLLLFDAIVTKGLNTNSYKFALWRALANLAPDTDQKRPNISKQQLAPLFLNRLSAATFALRRARRSRPTFCCAMMRDAPLDRHQGETPNSFSISAIIGCVKPTLRNSAKSSAMTRSHSR